jgi:GT2 family glycosyltransferase
MKRPLSIIIPTFNRSEHAAQALRSVIAQLDIQDELIVVDQRPQSNQLKELCARSSSQVHYHCLKQPNLPAARNHAISHSRGEIIVFIDDDCILHKNCLAEHRAAFDSLSTIAAAGRIKQGGRLQWANTATVASINPLTAETCANFDVDKSGPVSYASGGHMAFSRSLIGTVGGFNPRFRGNALFEDVDYSLRVRASSATIHYLPLAIVEHYPSDAGGCHSAHLTRYLLDRLHNHTLFYLLHLQPLPSAPFLRYLKNLTEYICRTPSGKHSPRVLLHCMAALSTAYIDAAFTRLNGPQKVSA